MKLRYHILAGLAILLNVSYGFTQTEHLKQELGKIGMVRKPPVRIKKYTAFEISLGALNPGKNPYTDGPELSAIFTAPDKTTYRIKGYWDGGNVFSVRFSPVSAGTWTFTTISSDSGLNGIKGAFEAVNPTKNELKSNVLYHGFLMPSGYSWKLSDGIQFLPVGETQWSFAEEFHTEEWKDWIRVLKQRGYNSFMGCIWLALNDRAGISAFTGIPSNDELNEAFFDRLDEWIKYANGQGIQMGLTIGGFPDNSSWFSLFNTRERNERWFQYCVRRYAAFNVRWVLYGEIDEKNPAWSTWDENAEAMAQLIRNEDPYDHPIGSHHRYIDRATARSKNIDYLCIQSNRNFNGRMNADYQFLTTRDYRQYGKPLWFEEYWYESTEGLEQGIRNTYRNFIAGLAFPTMGSLMRAHKKDKGFVPELAKNKKQSVYNYLMENDSGMQCMQYFGSFFADLDILDFSPASEKIKKPDLLRQCGRFGNDYVIYMQHGGQVELDLTKASGKFKVEKLNIKSGNREKLPDISSGNWRLINSGDTADVILLVRGGNLSKPPVINSPLKESEFMPGEKVYVKGQGESLIVKVELIGGKTQVLLSTDSLESNVYIPLEVKDNQQVKITLTNKSGTIEQVHKVITNRKNRPPIITNTIASVFSGGSVGIQLGFSDPDGPGPYTFKIINGPAHGELSGTGNDRLYKPYPQFEGSDQFTWQINDGVTNAEKAATVTISVRKK